MKFKLIKSCFCVLALCVSASASFVSAAEWSLDNEQSHLSFISIKATDIGEVHSFSQLSGDISAVGEVNVHINLASVETLIPIRNERMQEFLFETKLFPTATLSANIDPATLQNLPTGATASLDVQATLSIKDLSTPLSLKIVAAKLSDDQLLVIARQPILLTAASAGLSDGVEKLRELAGLPNISQSVPVSFVLTFTHVSAPH
jgi:polyisoprenoid-binding protein YceI